MVFILYNIEIYFYNVYRIYSVIDKIPYIIILKLNNYNIRYIVENLLKFFIENHY